MKKYEANNYSKLSPDELQEIITMDDEEIPPLAKYCRICEQKTKYYNRKHDAYYCEACDEWLEKSCGDPDCDYCNDRPEKPSMVKESK